MALLDHAIPVDAFLWQALFDSSTHAKLKGCSLDFLAVCWLYTVCEWKLHGNDDKQGRPSPPSKTLLLIKMFCCLFLVFFYAQSQLWEFPSFCPPRLWTTRTCFLYLCVVQRKWSVNTSCCVLTGKIAFFVLDVFFRWGNSESRAWLHWCIYMTLGRGTRSFLTVECALFVGGGGRERGYQCQNVAQLSHTLCV